MKLSETTYLGTVPYTRFLFIFYRSHLYKSGFPLLQMVAESFQSPSGSSHRSVYHSELMQTQAHVCLKMLAWATPLLVRAFGTCLHPADLAPVVTTTTTATTASRVCSCCAESPVRGGAARPGWNQNAVDDAEGASFRRMLRPIFKDSGRGQLHLQQRAVKQRL